MLPDDYFKKNVEMWERFTAAYFDLMFKMAGKTVEQSTNITEHVKDAANTAMNMQLETTMTALQALQRQVESLSEKVDKMMEQG